MADLAAPRVNPGLGTKLLYGLVSVAFVTKDAGFSIFLLIYSNHVPVISATLLHLPLLLALVPDAVFDPIIGDISDNWRSRIGRRHPCMYGAALPVALLYFML